MKASKSKTARRKRVSRTAPGHCSRRGMLRGIRAVGREIHTGLHTVGRGVHTGLHTVGRGMRTAGRFLARGYRALERGWHRARHALYKAVAYILILGLLGSTLAATVSGGVVNVMKNRILTADDILALAEEQPFDCVLVLGAGLRPDGSPSDMLHDRVMYGCDIFLRDPGRFGVLLMSGDHTGDYNEVAAMKTLAVSLGVDSHKVFLDHEGYSTYESMSRAKDVFGAKRILIVTQAYHLYRALYIANTIGLDAYGYASDARAYRGKTKRHVREMLARYKDFFAANAGISTAPDAPGIDLTGDGDET